MSPPLPNGPTDVLSRRLPEIRKARHLSQAALAARLRDVHEVDVDRPQLANLEAGRRQAATVEVVVALGLALDVSPDVLVLPTDNRKVVLTPQVVVSADKAREWFTGRSLLLGAYDKAAGVSWPSEGTGDADERRAFWRSQRPDRERRAYARPGVAHLVAEVDQFAQAAGGNEPSVARAAMRASLERIRDEVYRQIAQLEREDAEEAG